MSKQPAGRYRGRALGQKCTLPHALLAACLLVVLCACGAPHPTIKIALVAPFEGRFREVGYDAFPAMRLALREQIRAGGIGNYEVEFVAYNDDADPAFAARVARNVVLDERVLAVIGHLRQDTTLAALPVYAAARLPLVAPYIPADRLPAGAFVYRLAPDSAAMAGALSACLNSAGALTMTGAQPFIAPSAVMTGMLGLVADLQSPTAARLLGPAGAGLCFAASAPYPRDLAASAPMSGAFAAVSGGVAAGPHSISAYDATRLILQAIRADIDAHGAPTRAGVAEALRRVTHDGLLGRISFDEHNAWAGAPVWVYQYDSAGVAQLVK